MPKLTADQWAAKSSDHHDAIDRSDPDLWVLLATPPESDEAAAEVRRRLAEEAGDPVLAAGWSRMILAPPGSTPEGLAATLRTAVRAVEKLNRTRRDAYTPSHRKLPAKTSGEITDLPEIGAAVQNIRIARG
jgi:hypothetical protein